MAQAWGVLHFAVQMGFCVPLALSVLLPALRASGWVCGFCRLRVVVPRFGAWVVGLRVGLCFGLGCLWVVRFVLLGWLFGG